MFRIVKPPILLSAAGRENGRIYDRADPSRRVKAQTILLARL
jgi:hypothetical protein